MFSFRLKCGLIENDEKNCTAQLSTLIVFQEGYFYKTRPSLLHSVTKFTTRSMTFWR
jgi:hypothetical protein